MNSIMRVLTWFAGLCAIVVTLTLLMAFMAYDTVLTDYQECIAGGQGIHCPMDETK